MHSLVRCCWVGATVGFAALVANACGNTSVSCFDLASCPEEGTGGTIDSGRSDAPSSTADGRDGAGGAGGAAAKDAVATEANIDASTSDAGARLDVAVEAAPEVGAEPREAEAGASDASIVDAVAEEVGPQCEAGSDPAVEPCIVDDAYGVFVSPAGRDTSDGSKAAPFRTIGRAVGVALARGGRVFACGSMGAYAETVAIGPSASGVSLYGGFDCATWVHSSAFRTVVRPTAPALALGVTGVTSLRAEDFEFDAVDATAPGDSSVSVFVSSSSGVVFTRVRVVAGNGANGGPGIGNATVAPAGVAGSLANAACATLITAAPGTRACGTEQSAGGSGGRGAGIVGASGLSGSPGVSTPMVVNANTRGLGGLGEGQQDASAWDCTLVETGLGQPGGAGTDGVPGVGATVSGTLSAAGWQSTSATAGLAGHIGQGGGGGGGASSPGACPSADAALPTGASGGSGGSGGCGGVGGGGGGSGGSSIAILNFASQLSLSACEIVTATGGRGGNGGSGQPGGSGGTGGPGSSGLNGSDPSCSGGSGGRGGSGGPGGGGAGGLSVGILSSASGSSVQVPVTTSFQPGTAGQGGLDGNLNSTGPGAGAMGIAMPQLTL